MAARQAAQHPGLPGMGFGLRESGLLAGREDGQAAFFLEGEVDGFRSRIFLAPQAGWGFFVAHNNGSASEMNGALTRILLETYFPTGTLAQRGDEAATRPLAEFAGRYRPVTGGGLGRLLPGPERVEVAVAGDGLAIDGQPVRRLGDDLFADESGDRVAFRVEDGQASYLLRDTFAYEREQGEGLALVLFGVIVLLIASLGGLAARRWRKR
jgi:hypothetical protein